ncbi:MAG: hypothetical protein NZ740_09950 [Kiritimatiellae bacterium]|nr:hypothetical protein [Kiritimatiellia bacterium]MDW8459415.1 hypothetical protein [Verrucomicrobiota bacterium]
MDYSVGGNQGMTGTIWILCLVNNHSNFTDVLFHLDHPDGPGNYVALVGTVGTTYTGPFNDGIPEPAMQYAGFTDYSSTADRAAGATHMLVVKIQMNMGGSTNDGCELWVDPPLNAGEFGLGFPIYSYGYADAFGAEFSGVGISFNKASALNHAKPRLDDIRISNGPNGFAEIISGLSPAPTRFTSAAVTDAVIHLEISDLTPGATNHLTRAGTLFDETWMTSWTFVASGLVTNWSEPAGNTVFYRVETER